MAMFLCVFVVFLMVSNSEGSPQCRDENGVAVDWFYVYKLPREKSHPNPLVKKGLAYMYLSPSKLRQGWILSNLGINNPNSFFGKTLEPLYQTRSILSLVYNDQPPNNTHMSDPLITLAEMYTKASKDTSHKKKKKHKSFRLGDNYYDDFDLSEMCKMHTQSMRSRMESGHTKGVVLADKSSALWLVHSVPKFPPIPDANIPTTYDYPSTGLKYGQTALCITLPTTTLNQIGLQLKYNEPLIPYSNVPLQFRNMYPNIEDVIRGTKVNTSPWYHIQSFESVVGRKFLSFAKSGRFHDDLYSGLVAEVLQTDLLVETWTNGPGPLSSECSRNFQVRNIEWVRFPSANLSFTSHGDHSKWAVAVAHKVHNSQDAKVADYWVCVGDINRAMSQESRGGGTVCTSGPLLWGNFAHLVEAVENILFITCKKDNSV